MAEIYISSGLLELGGKAGLRGLDSESGDWAIESQNL